MRSLVCVCVVALLLGSLAAPPARTAEPVARGASDVSGFMRVKLQHSQEILEALTTGNFPNIARNAQKLALLSHDSNWQVLQTEEYLRYSKDFRRLANDLTDAAKQENLDRATLAYMVLTMNCVHCHTHVRDSKRGR